MQIFYNPFYSLQCLYELILTLCTGLGNSEEQWQMLQLRPVKEWYTNLGLASFLISRELIVNTAIYQFPYIILGTYYCTVDVSIILLLQLMYLNFILKQKLYIFSSHLKKLYICDSYVLLQTNLTHCTHTIFCLRQRMLTYLYYGIIS